MKKLTYFAFALMLCITLSGCGKKPTESLDTVGTVDGENVPQALYAYALRNAKQEIANSEDTSAEDFWAKGKIDGVNAEEYARNKAKEDVEAIYAVRAYAKKQGDTMTSEDRKALDGQINSQIEQMGGKDQFNKALASIGINESILREAMLNAKYESKAKEKYIASLKEEDEKKYYKGMKRIKHILIKTADDVEGEIVPRSEKEIKTAKKKINEVLKQVRDGKNFEKLIKDYGEDPGMGATPDGYVFGEHDKTLATPFREAGLKLKPGETSGIVETVFGYHILKCYATIAKNFANANDRATIQNEMWTAEKDNIRKNAKVVWNEEKLKEVPIEEEKPETT